MRSMILRQALPAILLLCLGGKASAFSPSAPLPTPPGLAADVRFWEDVFGKYLPDECIFHDKDNLAMVYAVKRVEGDNAFQQARNVRRYLTALPGRRDGA